MSEGAAHWASVKEVGTQWGIRALIAIYRTFGRTLFFIALYPVVTYFFLTNRLARRASHEYLTQLTTFAPETPVRPTRSATFKHFLSFATAGFDRVAAWTGRIELGDLTFTGRDALANLIEQRRGAILLTAHIGSIEVCRAMARQRDNMRLNVLVHTEHAENFNRVMQRLSPNQNVELIEVGSIDPAVAMRLAHKVSMGEFIVVTGDRVPVHGSRTIEVDFLGRRATFPQGPFVLASLLKCPLLTLVCIAEGAGFHVFIEPLSERIQLRRGRREDDMRGYVAAFARRLEDACRRAPLQWFNFFPFWEE
jgi:predicted LPLAT superfamily acyltransferase